MGSMNSKAFTRLAAVCGMASAALFTVTWVLAGILEDNYDALRQDVSDFGALTASHPLPYNIAISTHGALAVVLAAGLFVALGRGLTARLGALAVAVFGVGDFLDGLLREDCSPSGSKACKAALDAGNASWHHQAHDLESVFTILAICIAPVLLAFAFRQRERWRDLFGWMLLAAAVTIVAVVWYAALFSAQDGSAYSGLLERIAIAAGMAWLFLVSWRLYQTSADER
jgi:hypothetical membrane protein